MKNLINVRNYIYGSFAYGFTKSFVYDNNKKELITTQITCGVITGIMFPLTLTPLSIYEDLCNIERYIRGMPINKNSKYII